MIEVAGLLLAGGRSMRMGTEKATLHWHGIPLWQRQAQVLRDAGAGQVWVSARTAPEWWPGKWLADAVEGAGPLGGLAAGLAEAAKSPQGYAHVLALAVDMPGMTAAYLRQLAARAKRGTGAAARVGGWFEGLAAIYPVEAAEVVLRRAASRDRSLQGLLRELHETGRMDILDEDESRPEFINLNRREDLPGVA